MPELCDVLTSVVKVDAYLAALVGTMLSYVLTFLGWFNIELGSEEKERFVFILCFATPIASLVVGALALGCPDLAITLPMIGLALKNGATAWVASQAAYELSFKKKQRVETFKALHAKL